MLSVISCSEYKLWGTIVAGANVTDIGFTLLNFLCRAEIAKLENMIERIDQQVLRLYIPVTETQSMDVSQSSEALIGV